MSGLSRASHRATGIALTVATVVVAGAAPVRTSAQTTPFVLQSISVGTNHACGITAQRVAYCWGRNAEGELGNPGVTSTCDDTGAPCSTKPVRVLGNLAFSAISAGHNYTCGVTTSGAAYCWGTGAYGQLGTGSQASSGRPARVGIEGVSFQTISAGTNHTCAVTAAGTAYCWGSNAGGMLGTSASLTGGRSVPAAVTGRLSFRTVNAGYFHTCGVTRDGATYCWGRNEQGEIGNGATAATATPVRVAGQFASRLVHPAVQFDFTCAVNQEGALYCWGANCFGQLGVDSTSEQCGAPAMPCSTSPKAVRDSATYQSVGANFSHTCALTTAGAVRCWGENNQGQLGNGTDGDRSVTPAPIVGGASYRAVAVGRQFTCAITTDGAAQCWGRNAEGQLGTGDTANRNTPTAVLSP